MTVDIGWAAPISIVAAVVLFLVVMLLLYAIWKGIRER